MPWTTPSLEDVRKQNRDYVAAKLGSGTILANSLARILADANAGLAYLCLLFIGWLARQFLPDTAERDWLLRHADIWLGGAKAATFAEGTATATGIAGTPLPEGSRLVGAVEYETTEEVTVGVDPTPVDIRALDAGAAGNLEAGTVLSFSSPPSGLDATGIVVTLTGGADAESVDDLRGRVLDRIRKPPMGGDADDYAAWALEVPGVTRAWCSPLEMGIGTVTVRFMMDDLRATGVPTTSGFPNSGDIAAVQAHLDAKRPVAVKDFFVVAPIAEPVGFTISSLDGDDAATRAALEASVAKMVADRARPAYAENGVAQAAQTIHREWVSAAILEAAGVVSFELTMVDHVMPTNGHMGVMGTATYV
jgi:uncharacterized phage protein gp47/JayE